MGGKNENIRVALPENVPIHLKCHVAGMKNLTVPHHSAGYISFDHLGSLGRLIPKKLEIKALLKLVLGGISSVALHYVTASEHSIILSLLFSLLFF